MLLLLPWLALTQSALAQSAQSSPEQSPPTPAASAAQMEQAPTTGALPLNAEQLALLDARATDLIGMEVTNPQGQDLGKIEDLVLDVAHARVRYAVVAYGGFLGLGSRFAAFPLSLFLPGREEGKVALNVSREQLEQAPSFDAGSWPNWTDERHSRDVDRFFLKDDELVRGASGGRLVRASDIIGRDVSDGGNRNAGSIEDLVVNLGNGQLRFAVLNYSTRLGFNHRLVPLPMAAFRVPSRPELPLFLLLDRDRVAKAEVFNEDDWPDFQSARARREIDELLSQFPQGNDGQQPGTSGNAMESGNATGSRGAGAEQP